MVILNNYLYLFVKDEISNNDYFIELRNYIKENNLSIEDVAADITLSYCSNIDYFGPYRYLDGIEDYLKKIKKDKEQYHSQILDIIENALKEGYIQNY